MAEKPSGRGFVVNTVALSGAIAVRGCEPDPESCVQRYAHGVAVSDADRPQNGHADGHGSADDRRHVLTVPHRHRERDRHAIRSLVG